MFVLYHFITTFFLSSDNSKHFERKEGKEEKRKRGRRGEREERKKQCRTSKSSVKKRAKIFNWAFKNKFILF